ncbi:chemotaxis protein [Altererythrobacter halimionae]|uniref:Chemotaxis protein n=2 Tax=Alteriqipengyuania halimionae TaxID=1926630 RepID=A0A6I4U3Q7_9SPHN|nr:chemotaxis protein [Alteriqipengyuania halimionae]
MEVSRIEAASQSAINRIPESCGEVTVGCSDVAGIVEGVIRSSERLREEQAALQGTVAALEQDQRQVASSSSEARALSERARARLDEGTDLIKGSLNQIGELLGLVDSLTRHVTDFTAAMEQVRSSSQKIDTIAETTNILALNATIEAMRAGEAGRTFAVVADEVKSLARDTRLATEEITHTIDALGGQAERVIQQIEDGAQASNETKTSVAQIEQTLIGVSDLVKEVDRQNEQITGATGTISDHVARVQNVMSSFASATVRNETQLEDANRRVGMLEMTANSMFDHIVHAGLSPEDSAMVEQARNAANEAAQMAEEAIADGRLSLADVFDADYQPIAGSNPPRFRNRMMDWAYDHWRPLLDREESRDPRVVAAACTDMNGYLPAHLTKCSQQPTGDVTHDTKFCRNGRIILDPIDQKSKKSTAPYMMAVYRQEGDGKTYHVVRNVYVPIFIEGRRWGDFELAYKLA